MDTIKNDNQITQSIKKKSIEKMYENNKLYSFLI